MKIITIILVVFTFIACDRGKTPINSELENAFITLSERLECEDLIIAPLNSVEPINSYRFTLINSNYSHQIKDKPEHYLNSCFELIVSNIRQAEILPDSFVIELKEGFFHNDFGQRRIFERHFSQLEINLEFEKLHSPESYISANGNQLLFSDSLIQLEVLCDSFIQLNLAVPLAYQLKALSSLKQQDTVNGLNSFLLALSHDSTNTDIHANLSYLYLVAGDSVSCVYHSDAIIDIDPNDPRPYFHKGTLLKNTNIIKSCELLRRAKELGLAEAASEVFIYCDY